MRKKTPGATINFRLNRKNDLDLLYFSEAGYNLSALFYEILSSFAHGIPYKIDVENVYSLEFSEIHDYRVHTIIPLDDKETMALINSIKPEYRTTFYKVLLRDTICKSNIRYFLINDDYNDIIYTSQHTSIMLDIEQFRQNSASSSSKKKKTHSTKIQNKQMRADKFSDSLEQNPINNNNEEVQLIITSLPNKAMEQPNIISIPAEKDLYSSSEILNIKKNDVMENIGYNINEDNEIMGVTDLVDEFSEIFG